MSQPYLVSRLRDARPVAPPELRERVRLIAAEASVPPGRILTWRRATVVLVPVAAAIAAAVVLLPGGGNQAASNETGPAPLASPDLALATGSAAKAIAPNVPAPSSTRAQRYSATVELRVPSEAAVSAATKRATQIVASLGGYPASLVVRTGGGSGYADLRFRVPRAHVREAVRRLSTLGTILNENVQVEDLQAQVNATADLIARLERQLAPLTTQTQTSVTRAQIGALTARIQRLQRQQAATRHASHYATVDIGLSTPAPAPPTRLVHGPLHGLGVAFHWLWIGLVYVLALGAPLVALVAAAWLGVGALRRRREDSLLRRS